MKMNKKLKKVSVVKNSKSINKFNILSLIILTMIVIFSIDFYHKIHWILSSIVLTLEVSTWIYLNELKRTKNIMLKGLLILICVIASLISQLGFISNGLNIIKEDINNQYRVLDNPKYIKYQETKKTLEYNLNKAEKNKNDYPTLEQFITNSKSPEWESKTKLITQYNQEKQKLENKITSIENDIKSLEIPEKTIKEKIKNTGLSNTLKSLENITGKNIETLTFFVFVIFGLILQLLMYSSRLLSNTITNTKNKSNIVNESTKNERKNVVHSQLHDSDKVPKKSIVIDISKKQKEQESINKQLTNKEKYLNYITNNHNNYVIPGVKKSSESLNISQREIQKYVQELKTENILTIENKRTKINTKELKNVK